MELVKKLYESGNFDHKNITNKSDKVIPTQILDQFDNDGVTWEMLEELLDVPIFKYRTQITIHGLFPKLEHSYINGYKHLFQNKNLSIGVKYNAIDAAKKKYIYTTLHNFNSWIIFQNSTEYYAYKSSTFFSTQEEYKTVLPEMKKHIENINKDLFIGECGITLYSSIMGGYFLMAYIRVDAIKETNVIPLIENICSESIENIQLEIKRKQEGKLAEIRAAQLKRDEERKAKAELEKPYDDEAMEILTKLGFTYVQNLPIFQNMIVATWRIEYTEEGEIFIKFFKHIFKKKSAQKKWRRKTVETVITELTLISDEEQNYSYYEYPKNVITGWIFQIETEKSKEPVSINVGDIKIIDYSDKAIVLVGESTRQIKEQLKDLGGRFNFRLTCGPGWVFPKTKREEIEKLLNNI